MNLILHPNKILRQKSVVVDKDENLSTVFFEMKRIMQASGGIGLASNQVGLLARFFIMQVTSGYRMGDGIKVCINPEILDRSVECELFFEGCLSFPGKRVRTHRPMKIIVGYENEKREHVEEQLDGIDAICFQHELDHLNGKTMFQRAHNGRI